MRVSPDELVVDPAGNRSKVAGTPLLEQKREERDLEEEISELVEELLVVARERGVRDLVRLLDGVRDDRGLGLRAVPRTIAPQPLGQFLEIDERPLEAVAAAHAATRFRSRPARSRRRSSSGRARA